MILTGAQHCQVCMRRERAFLVHAIAAGADGAAWVWVTSTCPECTGTAEAYGISTPHGIPLQITHIFEIPIGQR